MKNGHSNGHDGSNNDVVTEFRPRPKIEAETRVDYLPVDEHQVPQTNGFDTVPMNETSTDLLNSLLEVPVDASNRSKVLKRSDTSAFFDAHDAVEQATSRARSINAESDRVLNHARDSGLAQAYDIARKDVAVELHNIQHSVNQFYEDSEATVAELVMQVAAKFIDTSGREAVATRLVRDEIIRHRRDEPYAIHVAPDTAPSVDRALDAVHRENPGLHLPTVRIDSRLTDGRAILLTQFGSVDLDVETQLKAIRESLIPESATQNEEPKSSTGD